LNTCSNDIRLSLHTPPYIYCQRSEESKSLIEKLIVDQPVNFRTYYEAVSFVTLFTRALEFLDKRTSYVKELTAPRLTPQAGGPQLMKCRSASSIKGKKNSSRKLVGSPEGKRPLIRSRQRYVNNIEIDPREVRCDMDRVYLVQDREMQTAPVNMVMNFRDQ
jgi:hypothetical protein